VSERKKPEEPQEEGSPAWMNTYGDMVTLVLTFFVLLFSFSTVDAVKWDEVVNSLAGTRIVAIMPLDPNAPEKTDENSQGRFIITSPTPMPSETPAPSAEPSKSAEPSNSGEQVNGMSAGEIQKRFNELYEKIKGHVENNNLGYMLNVGYIDDYTVLIRMSDKTFFDPGSAVLDKASKKAIKGVGGILVEYEKYIRMIHIEGHTDNVPIKNSRYSDNWDLSYARANTVREFLLKYTEFSPSLMAVTAYGEYQPVASNKTAKGRAKNRRVDFVIESILKG
jgi:chemotaxis protein MotB